MTVHPYIRGIAMKKHVWTGILIASICLLRPLFILAENEDKEPDYLESIEVFEEFGMLEGLPLSSKYGRVGAVKVVYDIETEKLYFIHSSRYQFHYGFCKEVLRCFDELYLFNERNYAPHPKRDYVLATVNHYEGKDWFVLEFSSTEEVVPLLADVYDEVAERAYFGKGLKLFFSTNKQIADFSAMCDTMKSAKRIPTVRPDEVYEGLVYQPLNERKTFGYLRMSKADEKNIIADKKDILLLDGTPNDIPLVSGVITVDFQTPLSHINVLCHNRGTPFMAYKDALKDDRLLGLVDSLVEFTVYTDSFVVRKADIKEAEDFWEGRFNKELITLDCDRETSGLIPLEELHYRQIDRVGGKAANFGELARVKIKPGNKRLTIPENAFAIPFYYYEQHLSENGIDVLIDSLLAIPDILDQPYLLDLQLSAIRKKIKAAPVDTALVRLVSEQLAGSPYSRFRFRSSTNAEDIPGFNGAGLYDSKTGVKGDSVKTYAKAIGKVWASLWNLRAFQERAYFNIDQHSVAMGILVHRSFPDEIANGVAITSNLYRAEVEGHVVNVQLGETSIVKPPEGVTCEQVILLTGWKYHRDYHIAEYISYSSLNNGKPILSDTQLQELEQALTAIKKHYFYSVKHRWKLESYYDLALDVEFKFDNNGLLYIKQVRPYN